MAWIVFLGGSVTGSVAEIENDALGDTITVEQTGEVYAIGAFTFKEDAYLVAVIEGEKPVVLLESYVRNLIENRNMIDNGDSNDWGSQYDYN